MHQRINFINKLTLIWKLSFTEKLWLIPLFVYSGFVRVAILLVPFRLLAKFFGTHNQNLRLSTVVLESQKKKAVQIGYIIQLVSRNTPWQSKCLVQAIMARTLLGLYAIPYVFYLGVKTNKQSPTIRAHAWINVGSNVVVGVKGYKQFTIVGSFVSPSLFIE